VKAGRVTNSLITKTKMEKERTTTEEPAQMLLLQHEDVTHPFRTPNQGDGPIKSLSHYLPKMLTIQAGN
jgi:hypothetical protein